MHEGGFAPNSAACKMTDFMTPSVEHLDSRIQEGLPDPAMALAFRQQDSIGKRLARHAAGQAAILSQGETWSYAEVIKASRGLAARISSLTGRAPGVVFVLGSRNAGMVISLLALVEAGLAFVVLDPSFPLERNLHCIGLVQPLGLLSVLGAGSVSPRLREAIQNRGGGGFILELPARKEALLSSASGNPLPPPGHDSPKAPPSENLFYIAFTSGSTGSPKAVLGSHEPMAHFIDWQQQQFGLSAADRVSMLSGLGHDPLLRDIFTPLSIGATICVPPGDCFTVPHRLHDWMRESQITLCHLTPSLATLLLAGAARRHTQKLDSLRLAFFGGEPLSYALARRFKAAAPNVTIVNCYGATETPQVAGFHVLTAEELRSDQSGAQPEGIVPIGRGISDFQLLVQAADGRLCAVGEEGEICVRSPYLAREVWDEAGRPRAAYQVNPHTHVPSDLLYPTGDYGYYLPDGSVAYVGRRDKQVKVRGHRVQLEEVERLLAAETGLLAHHFDLRSNDGALPSFSLYLVPEPGLQLDLPALKGRLAEKLPDYMVPDRLFTVPGLPVTPNGKVDVERLRRTGSSPALPPAPSAGNSGSEESRLLRLCAHHLGVPSLTVQDSLLAAGLNSLQAITLCCAIEAEFGVILAVQDIISCGSVCALADRLDTLLATPDSIPPLPAVVSKVALPPHGETASSAKTPDAASANAPSGFRLLPRNENVVVGIKNRLLQIVARVAPDALRVKCHRWRGVTIGRHLSIGYDTIVETAYPWLVRIGNEVNIGMRVTIIAHFRGMGSRDKGTYTVEIDDLAFIGPGVIILPNVKVGRGAVISAGSVVNASIPPMVMAHGNPAVPIARCGIPLSGDASYAEFLQKLQPL